MSTDESYASFLEKANQDTSSNKGTTSSANVAQIRTVDTEVPPALENVNEEYNSETERKFKPIALKWSGNGDFGIDEFRKLVGHKNKEIKVTQMEINDWDLRGEYKEAVKAVKSVGANAKVFRAKQGRTRVEYWVLAVDKAKGRVVGLMGEAVES